MSRTEAIEVTRIHSVAGLHAGGLITARPFRAPHHSISPAGLVGGGAPPRPGEATLANHGVLFLDELSEFQRPALEALRQPLEDGHVTIVRGQRGLLFPTRFMLVAATNPCPCGFAGVGDRCRCGEADLRRHQRQLSGPLLDRMDLLVNVDRPSEPELRAEATIGSAEARERVADARERQRARLAGTVASCNGEMDRASPVASFASTIARSRAQPGLRDRRAERPRPPPRRPRGAHDRRPRAARESPRGRRADRARTAPAAGPEAAWRHEQRVRSLPVPQLAAPPARRSPRVGPIGDRRGPGARGRRPDRGRRGQPTRRRTSRARGIRPGARSRRLPRRAARADLPLRPPLPDPSARPSRPTGCPPRRRRPRTVPEAGRG